MYDRPPEQLTTAIGAQSLSDPSLHEIPVVAVSISPDFHLIPSTTDPENLDRASASGNIAELTLAHPVDGVEPLARASAEPEPVTRARFYGHGWTPDNSKSDVLLSGELDILPTSDCRKATGRTTAEPPLVCAQDRTITDATSLDQDRSVQAGGPLVMFLNGTPTVLGVFSFGTETVGRSSHPGSTRSRRYDGPPGHLPDQAEAVAA
ncbi:trypsin-like serine protease [Rhodococcus fascians]|nr:trypsin-like serine protease [Rhodococcus fascians]